MPFPHPAPNNATIDYFPLQNKRFLRFGLWEGQASSCSGSVMILNDYGNRLEDLTPLAVQLQRRHFHVASFEWGVYSQPQNPAADILPAPVDDFRSSLQHLHEVFLNIFLPHLPAPFYVFGIGMGALLSLAAHRILQSQVRRMLLVAPLFAPHGHKVGGAFHHYVRFMGDLGLSGWRTNRPITDILPATDAITIARQACAGYRANPYPTVGCYQAMLDAAQMVLSPEFRERISIPLLCMLSSTDPVSETKLARQFCESLRCGTSITLRHAKRLAFAADAPHARQFWSAFDAFIPGTGAPHPDRSLEDGLVM